MKVSYRELEAVPGPQASVQVRFRLDAPNVDQAGWQIYDPESGRFITEGQWVPVDSTSRLDLQIELPPQPGAYRIYVSPRAKGEWLFASGQPFVAIDTVVDAGQARVTEARITTLSALRREAILRSLPSLFTEPFRSIATHRRLISSMVRRDILARYRGSFGDVFWTVLNPLLLMATYFFVFGIVLRTRFAGDSSRTGFALYFLAGFLSWLGMSEAVGRAPSVVLEYRNLVKKLVFPLEILPITHVLAGLVSSLFAMAIYVVALIAIRGGLPATVLWLPAILIPQVLFTLGLCWFLAATGAFVRDLAQVIGFLLTLWFFITPICYPESQLPPEAFWFLKKNPLFVIVHAYRAIFLEARPPDFYALGKLWLVAIVTFVFGYAWFRKLRKSFADVI